MVWKNFDPLCKVSSAWSEIYSWGTGAENTQRYECILVKHGVWPGQSLRLNWLGWISFLIFSLISLFQLKTQIWPHARDGQIYPFSENLWGPIDAIEFKFVRSWKLTCEKGAKIRYHREKVNVRVVWKKNSSGRIKCVGRRPTTIAVISRRKSNYYYLEVLFHRNSPGVLLSTFLSSPRSFIHRYTLDTSKCGALLDY